MNRYYFILLTFMLVGLSGSLTSADLRNQSIRYSDSHLANIEANLVCALKSENRGMQTSAAIVLKQIKLIAPEYRFSNTIIPLMRIVKSEYSEPSTRVTAALALHELNSGRGDFAIKQTARFTGDEHLKQICVLLAVDRQREETP